MTFSVIVPVYNVEDYLGACLDSILSQKGDFEIIAVDDGSTDRSGVICDEYAAAHENLRVIHQSNRGLGGARNTGIDAAKGDRLIFVDSDDTLAPDAIAALERAAAESDPDMIVFGIRNVDGEGRTLGEQRENAASGRVFSFEEDKSCLLFGPSACNKAFRRELFAGSGIRFPERVWYEDLRTVPKLTVLCERIVYLDVLLYNYLMRPGSIMNSASLDRNREIMWAADDLIGHFKETGRYGEIERELEMLTTEHVLIFATVRVLKSDPRSGLLKEFYDYTEKRFPDYMGNPYLKRLPRAQALALRLIRAKRYRLLAFLFGVKDRIRG